MFTRWPEPMAPGFYWARGERWPPSRPWEVVEVSHADSPTGSLEVFETGVSRPACARPSVEEYIWGPRVVLPAELR